MSKAVFILFKISIEKVYPGIEFKYHSEFWSDPEINHPFLKYDIYVSLLGCFSKEEYANYIKQMFEHINKDDLEIHGNIEFNGDYSESASA